ncbi:MAG: L,D-transpeptidase [Mogibacterium sp.]|nr:L,D-transpeptidase [Mogibacterium sp.]
MARKDKFEVIDEEITTVPADDEPPKAKRKGKGKWIVALLLLLVLGLGGFCVFRAVNATTFPKGVKINGVDVGGTDAKEAIDRLQAAANHVTIVQDGETVAEVETAYTFDFEEQIDHQIMVAAVDPRAWLLRKVDYDMPVAVKGGYDETAVLLREALPDAPDTVYSKDAYIDYEDLTVIPAVYGNNIDYKALSEGIAAHMNTASYGEPFSFVPEDYLDQPDVVEADLTNELNFAKEYLGNPLVLTSDANNEVTLTTAQMAKIIKYSPAGPEYSLDGAREVAAEINKDYEPWQYRVNTVEGIRTLNNYVAHDEIDIEKTAQSIYNAAVSGDPGIIYAANPDAATLPDHVEVSITSQKLYTVQNGKVTHTIDVITGRPGWETDPGIFNVYYKQRDVMLYGTEDDYYESHVEYWMPFNGGAGMHDATWHSVFGGDLYLTQSGSHGCVGMSLEDAKTVYEIVDAGYLVVIYY